MREFDLEAAKAGAAVCTRNGAHVEIILYNGRTDRFPILAYVGSSARVRSFMDNGRYRPKYKSESDLMMRDDDYAEKLARGEYGPTVKEKLTVDNPTCKESLPVDREYWRRVYAGQIMPVVLHAAITTGAKVKDEYKDMPADVAIARSTITLADALLAELEKK